jgi:aryl-alcohol dehydrogenase-like predicted oxidoreductase
MQQRPIIAPLPGMQKLQQLRQNQRLHAQG